MHFDKHKRQILGEMLPEELLTKRREVIRMFRAQESLGAMSSLPFLIAWIALGKALGTALGEHAIWIWLGLALVGAYLTQISSRVPWRAWASFWGIAAVVLAGVTHQWLILAIAGLSFGTGALLIAIAQEKKARALGMAGKYDLLNANGSGNRGDIRSVDDLRELHEL